MLVRKKQLTSFDPIKRTASEIDSILGKCVDVRRDFLLPELEIRREAYVDSIKSLRSELPGWLGLDVESHVDREINLLQQVEEKIRNISSFEYVLFSEGYDVLGRAVREYPAWAIDYGQRVINRYRGTEFELLSLCFNQLCEEKNVHLNSLNLAVIGEGWKRHDNKLKKSENAAKGWKKTPEHIAKCKVYEEWLKHPRTGRYKAAFVRKAMKLPEVDGALTNQAYLEGLLRKWEKGEAIPEC